MNNLEVHTFESMMTPDAKARVNEIRQDWSERSYEDTVKAASEVQTVEPRENSSRAYIVEPEGTPDESGSTVLSLPYMNGWTTHHYIRAKVAQQFVAPNKRMIVFPNNTGSQENYDLNSLNEADIARLNNGSVKPIAEMHMRTLETINRDRALGMTGMTGYSKGGLIVLDMARLASDELDGVSHLNIDEAPSHKTRSSTGLTLDFLFTGGNLGKAVKGSGIEALSEAMRGDRLARDLARFSRDAYSTHEGKVLRKAMTGSIDLGLTALNWGSESQPAGQDIKTKVGMVEGSKICDPESLTAIGRKAARVVHYSGPGFQKHASADNVILHALMVNDGLNPSDSAR